jgi:phosphatidylinositol 3-kinase
LKKGRQKCKLWIGVEADGLSDTTTPSPVESNDEMDRLEKVRLYQRWKVPDAHDV